MEQKDPHLQASWGEFDPSLEDMIVLISVPLVGDSHAIGMTLKGDDQKRLPSLNKSLSDSMYASTKATYMSWAKFFEEDEGRNNRYQVEDLLAY